MTVRKTKAGWVAEITATENGMLVQGGICNREELYKRETPAKHGIDYDAEPDHYDICDNAPNIEWLANQVGCDKVLRKGYTVE